MRNINITIGLFTIIMWFAPSKNYPQWVQADTSHNFEINALAVIDNNIDKTSFFAGTNGNGILHSTDNGSSWSIVLPEYYVYALEVADSNLFVGDNYGADLSTDNGASFNPINSGFVFDPYYHLEVLSFTRSDTNIFAGTTHGVYVSPNMGNSWNTRNSGLPITSIYALIKIGQNLFAGTWGDGVYISTNYGNSWTATNSGFPYSINIVYAFANIGNKIFAGVESGSASGNESGVFISSDNGNSWSAVNNGLPNSPVTSFVAVDSVLFAGSLYGVYRSSNFGASWSAVNSGFPSQINVKAFTLINDTLFAGTGNGVWKQSVFELITSIKSKSNPLPNKYKLYQNYPNPFNSTTTINYSVPKTSNVTIKVYDILGKEIATLVEEEKQFGNYNINYDASDLTSGIYFYKMQVDNFSETKKFILLK